MSGFALIVLAALIWLGLHIGVAGSRLRATIVAHVGERWFRAGFSVASIGALALLIAAYVAAPEILLWRAPDALRWVLAVLMLPAFVLFVAALGTRNPTAVGGEGGMIGEPRGILRITRHPMLWSFAIWGFVHLIGTGDLASLIFFGTFLVTAMAGMPSIDAKLAERRPAVWRQFAAATSISPGAAIAEGRNRLVPGEIGWTVPLIGVALWAALLWLHPTLFGVQPLPIR